MRNSREVEEGEQHVLKEAKKLKKTILNTHKK